MDSYLGLAQSKVKPRSVVDAFSNRTATIKQRPARAYGYATTSRPISSSSIVIDTAAQLRYLQDEHRKVLEKYKQLEESYSSLQADYTKVMADNERLQGAYEELQENYNGVTAKNFNAGKFLVYLKLKRRTDKETLEKRNIIKTCFNTYLQDVVMLDHPRIPKVVHECIAVLEANEKFMKSPGLYRVSGDHNTIQNLRYDINANNYKRLRKLKSPHEVCGILKLFLRELKDPLISLETCEKFLSDVEQLKLNTRSKMKALINSLDDVRQNTLKVLMKHLRNVAAYEENEVDSFSLALLFSSLIFNETLADVCPVKFQNLTAVPRECILAMMEDFEAIFD